MATRPVFIPMNTSPYVSSCDVDFVYNSGFAVSQKQKNITAIHRGFNMIYPETKVLEISSKSMQEGGTDLSAFHLHKYVPSLGRSIPVENIYHAGKVFSHGGPYEDLLFVSPKDAKRDERLNSSGQLIGFRFEGKDFPILPKTLFYDFLYINALFENEENAKVILDYGAFTDIEFNPQKSINCQAKAAALFVSLNRLGLIDKVRDPEEFIGLFQGRFIPTQTDALNRTDAEAPRETAPAVKEGDRILHKVWGEGAVISVSGAVAVINFPTVGEKKLGTAWVAANCTIVE